MALEGRGAGPGRHPIYAATPCQPDERFVGFSSVCKRQNGSSTVLFNFFIFCYIRTNSLGARCRQKWKNKNRTENITRLGHAAAQPTTPTREGDSFCASSEFDRFCFFVCVNECGLQQISLCIQFSSVNCRQRVRTSNLLAV